MIKKYLKHTSHLQQQTFRQKVVGRLQSLFNQQLPVTVELLQDLRTNSQSLTNKLRHTNTKQKIILSLVFVSLIGVGGLIVNNHQNSVSQAEFRRNILGAWDYTSDKNKAGLIARLRTEGNTASVQVERENSKLNFNLPVNKPKMEVKNNKATYLSEDGITEVVYELQDNKLKESIILHQPTEQYDFVSSLVMENLHIKTNSNDLPVFFDQQDQYQFHLEKPFAEDSAGNRTYNVTYNFRPKTAQLGGNPFAKDDKRLSGNLLNLKLKDIEVNTNEFELVVVVDPNWLNDPARQYPVTIDPTVTHDETSEFATGQFNRLTDTGSGSSPVLEAYYQELTTDPHMMGLWHLNESSGTRYDAAKDNNLTDNNTVTSGTGKLGTAADFETSNSEYLSISDNAALSLADTNFSFTGWFNMESIVSNGMIWTKYTDASVRDFQIYTDPTTGILHFNLFNTSGTSIADLQATGFGNLSTGVWYFFYIYHDADTNQVGISINGEAAEVAATSGSPGDTAANVQIGARAGTLFFDGLLDELSFRKRLLTPEEISAIYSRRPYAVYTSPVIDLSDDVTSWTDFTWTELGVATGDGETVYDDTNLVAQWNFNETSGTTANNDAEGTSCGGTPANCDGTLSGFDSTASQDADPDSSWTANNRRWGAGALQFDGINSYVDVGAVDTGLTNITISTWFKTSVATNTGQLLYYGNILTGGNYYGAQLLIYNGNVEADIGTGTSSRNQAVSPLKYNDGRWHQATATYDGTTLKLYVDGLLVKSDSTVTGDIAYTGSPNNQRNIGAKQYDAGPTTDNYFAGVIDSVTLYSRALTASEILSNYNSSNIEFQTRVGATSDANDGSWEAWKPTTSETLIDGFEAGAQLTSSDTSITTNNGLNFTQDIYPGDGADGAITVSSSTNINTTSLIGGRSCADGGDAVNYTVTADETTGSTSITLSSTPSSGCFTAGDEFIIINMQGTSSNYGNVGLWETHTISSISTDTLSFTDYPLQHRYDGTTQKIVVQRVPNYTSVTVNSGQDLNVSAWNGTKGGLLFFRATGTVTATGNITVDSLGYQGGSGSSCAQGYQGESYPGAGTATYTANGGGGGSQQYPTNSWGGGAGGNYGGGAVDGTKSGGTGSKGLKGDTYGQESLERLFLGSGGAGGSEWCGPSTAGGAGAGIIGITADTITVSGTISADGAAGTADNYAAGGGGSGGSVLLQGDSITLGSSLVSVSGGAGGSATGGAGGKGRIAITYDTSISGAPSTVPYIDRFNSLIKEAGSGALQVKAGSAFVDSSTVALWHLDETNGDNAGVDIFDESSNNHDGEFVGTNVATTVVDGISGKAREFNGSDDTITVSDSDNWYFGSNDFSVSMWIKLDATSFPYTLFSQGVDTNNYFRLNLHATQGAFIFAKDSGTDIVAIAQGSTSGWSADTWYHVVLVRNGSNWNIYRNGISVVSGSDASALPNYSSSIGIGSLVYNTGEPFDGIIDEVRVSNVARNAEEIAEEYRMGRDHYLNKTISSTDLSSKKSLPFWIAADRPGTYLETTIGESTFANYQPDANTTALWHLDEGINDACNSGSDDACDSSGNTHHGDQSNSPTIVQGKIGKARNFVDSSSQYISVADSGDWSLGTNDFTIDLWTKFNDVADTTQGFIHNGGTGDNDGFSLLLNASSLKFYVNANTDVFTTGSWSPSANTWYHLAVTRSGNDWTLYINGVAMDTATNSVSINDSNDPLIIGQGTSYGSGVWTGASDRYLDGLLDEVRISSTARSAGEIRQAYEVGLRTHPITIDFAASLDSGNLISGSGDLGFTIDATTYGLEQNGDGLYLGDKVIVRETVDDTEYIAQGTVASLTTASGATTVTAWDAGSTFPSGGYTANASVFKWQREYFDISNLTLDSFMDGITNLTFRVTNGHEGRTVWLDDMKSAGDYLTTPLGSTITSSTGNQYFQYRTIFHSLDPFVSAQLTTASFDYITQTAPSTPSLDVPTDAATNQSVTPALKTTTTDGQSDYLRYKIQICEDEAMTTNCQTFDQTSSQTGWSGQDAQTSTAYASGTQATYTIQTELTTATTYYWRSYAIDPGGTNTWSSTQGTPYSFTTTTAPDAPTTPFTEGVSNPPAVTDTTPEFSAIHNDSDGDAADYFEIEVNTESDFSGTVMWDSTKSAMNSTASGARSQDISYAGTSLTPDGTAYHWRIRFWDVNGAVSDWSATQSFSVNVLETSTACIMRETNNDSQLSLSWNDSATAEDGYTLQRSVNGGAFSLLQDLAANSTSHVDSTVSQSNTYSYRVAPYKTGPIYGDWCYFATLDLSVGDLLID